jgi:mannan endo-1,4-beta-mannosidase
VRRADVFLAAHRFAAIDYATFHLWPKNWRWLDVSDPNANPEEVEKKIGDYIDQHLELARQLRKPLVLEEFGIERDRADYRPQGTTRWRDRLYRFMFDRWFEAGQRGAPVGGTNFWAWSGEARSPRADFRWQDGDPFFGDPPQEAQGLNSVFNTDATTLAILRRHAEQMQRLSGSGP